MTDFEKYLQAQKREMELQEVNPAIWEGIQKEMNPLEKKSSFLWRRIAAVAAIFILGIVFSQVFLASPKLELPAEILAAYGFENGELDLLLAQQIKTIRESRVPVGHKNDLQLLLNQVQYLDETFQSKVDYLLENEYEENIAKEVLQYYKRKSELLDKVIFEIQKINENEKTFNVKSEKATLAI